MNETTRRRYLHDKLKQDTAMLKGKPRPLRLGRKHPVSHTFGEEKSMLAKKSVCFAIYSSIPISSFNINFYLCKKLTVQAEPLWSTP